jgi:hypothetical protein
MFRSGFKIRSGPVALAVAGLALFMSMGGTGYAIGAVSHAPAAPAAPTAPVWHAIDLTGGWQDAGFNTPTPAWWLDSNHVLHLRGDVVSGSIKAPVFTLPAGARPGKVLFLAIYGAGAVDAGLTVRPNGKAFFRDNAQGATVAQWASLDGVSFPIP